MEINVTKPLPEKLSDLATTISNLEHEIKIMRDAHHSEAIDLADNLTKQLEIERAVNQNRNNMNMLARDIDYKSTMLETLKPELTLLEQQIFDAQTIAEQEAQAAAVPKIDFEDDVVLEPFDVSRRIPTEMKARIPEVIKEEIEAAHAASGITEEEFRAMVKQAMQQPLLATVESTDDAKKVIDSWLKFNTSPNDSNITPELTTSSAKSCSETTNKDMSDSITDHLANMVAEDIANHPSVKLTSRPCDWERQETIMAETMKNPLPKWRHVPVSGTNNPVWDTVSDSPIDVNFPHVVAKATELHPDPCDDVTSPAINSVNQVQSDVPVLGSIVGEEMLTPVYQEATEPDEVMTKPTFQNITWRMNHASCGNGCNGTSQVVVNTTTPT